MNQNTKYPKQLKVYQYPAAWNGKPMNGRPIFLYSWWVNDHLEEQFFYQHFEGSPGDIAEVCTQTTDIDYIRLFEFLAWHENKIGAKYSLSLDQFNQLAQRFRSNSY